jgi:predicted AlkP superfamily pyrophosphatase or phosphodiesterase
MGINKRKKAVALLAVFVFSMFFLYSCGEQPYAEKGVFVIAIDGLRPDMLAKAETPNLDRMAKNGASNFKALATIPTQTRVNFVTFPTGTHADKHGVVGSAYMNENWKYRSTDYPSAKEAQQDIPVPTVFEVLKQEKGLKTAYIASKGYELVGGRGADFQVQIKNHVSREVWDNRYERLVDGSEKKGIRLKQELNKAVLDKMKEAVRDRRVEFFIANFGSLDYIGHQYGVSDAYRQTVEKSDAQVGEFIDFLDNGNFYDEYMIIIVADHGFTHVKNPKNVIFDSGRNEPDIPELGEAGIEHAAMSRGGGAYSLYIKNKADVPEAYQLIRDKKWAEKIYSQHKFPGLDGTLTEINYYDPSRTGDFFIDINPAYSGGFTGRGQHGSTADRDRLVPHIFYGAGIASGVKLENSENVDIAPTVLAAYGIDHREFLDSDGQVLSEVFKNLTVEE